MKKFSVLAVVAIAIAVAGSAFTASQRTVFGLQENSNEKSLGDITPNLDLCDGTPDVHCYKIVQDQNVTFQGTGYYIGE